MKLVKSLLPPLLSEPFAELRTAVDDAVLGDLSDGAEDESDGVPGDQTPVASQPVDNPGSDFVEVVEDPAPDGALDDPELLANGIVSGA